MGLCPLGNKVPARSEASVARFPGRGEALGSAAMMADSFATNSLVAQVVMSGASTTDSSVLQSPIGGSSVFQAPTAGSSMAGSSVSPAPIAGSSMAGLSVAGPSKGDSSVSRTVAAKTERCIPRARKGSPACSSTTASGLEGGGSLPGASGASVNARTGTPVKDEIKEEGNCGGGGGGGGEGGWIGSGLGSVPKEVGAVLPPEWGGPGDPPPWETEQVASTESKPSLEKRGGRAGSDRRRCADSATDGTQAQARPPGNMQQRCGENVGERAGEGGDARPLTPPLANSCPKTGGVGGPPLGNSSCPKAGIPLTPPLGSNPPSCPRAGGAQEEEGDSPGHNSLGGSSLNGHNSLGGNSLNGHNSLGGNSVSGGEMPDSFEGWEDFFAESGCRLEDLGALKGLDEGGSGGSRFGVEVEDSQFDVDVRQRACSDSVLSNASSSSSAMERSAWRLSLDGGVGIGFGGGQEEGIRWPGGGGGNSAGRGGGAGRRAWEQAEEGERDCRGVSDSAAICAGSRGVAGAEVGAGAGAMGLLSAPGTSEGLVAHGRRGLYKTSPLTEMDVVPEFSGLGQEASGGAGAEAQWGVRLAEPAGVENKGVCQDALALRHRANSAASFAEGLNACGSASGAGNGPGKASPSGAATEPGNGLASGAGSESVGGPVSEAVVGDANSVNAATLQTLSMLDPPVVVTGTAANADVNSAALQQSLSIFDPQMMGGTLPFGTLPGLNDPMGAGICGVEGMPGGWISAAAGVGVEGPGSGLGWNSGGAGGDSATVLQESLAGVRGGITAGLGAPPATSSGMELPLGGGGGPLLVGGQLSTWPSAMDAHFLLQAPAGGAGCGGPLNGQQQQTIDQQLQMKNIGGGGGGGAGPGGGSGSSSAGGSSQELLSRRPPRH